MEPDHKRTPGDLSEIDALMEESGGESPRFELDLVRRKENKEEDLSKRKLGFRELDVSVKIDGEGENASFEDEREDRQQASPQPEPVSTHVRSFSLFFFSL
jgi:hypothetical protein